ncbi:MAG: aminomethyl-transferring glycine dehydrogenase subunit GcvPB [Candidatus Riflebacteria bacterium]|jgi:glycine dehydrogenase subunit 2|nr:aminomethyl-transferring glycine dehydrogenase subunit GcvPB [Candidatus Riflebacteria bacterium]MDD3375854.1 aminomethyl-transferring glycine dehydrogenase subunit GcvPB [Candidatus Riflebacteria bacterium]NLV95478.1 aminomethyl-transferring glycine dehydrogenase subunit GcvPB [Candidatus Riflebacteria bacterium]
MTEPLLFELDKKGRRGYALPKLDVPTVDPADHIPTKFLRKQLNMPSLSELETVRHFTRLSRMNHSVDVGFYPLGSCTMKYNPKVNENIARLPGFANIHPHQNANSVQGALKLLKTTEKYLAELTGMDAITLQPAAGAHGELTGLLIIKAYHNKKGNNKKKILIPDSGHGTNPASCTMVGYEVVNIKSDNRGCIDIEDLKANITQDVAGLMITNPNTLGLFDENIGELASLVHSVDGLLYYDGANFNAIMGWTRPGDMGFDVVHLNLHKTFSTPHGGGGPGSGPVGVKAHLKEFLPTPFIIEENNTYSLKNENDDTIGAVLGSLGNFSVIVKALAYMMYNGKEGLKAASAYAVLNANYMMKKLKDTYYVPYDRFCKHEFVISGKTFAKHGVKTLDIAKRLLDFGYHSPTIYFPLIVEEAMMFEPTETESKDTLDGFIDVMEKIAKEAVENSDLLKNAPVTTPVRRLDEATAARKPDINFYQKP